MKITEKLKNFSKYLKINVKIPMGNAQEKANLEETLLKFSSPLSLPPLLQIQLNYTPTLTQTFSISPLQTCQSLYNEAFRIAQNNRFPFYQDIIALESINSNEMIDYWLMKPEFTLEKFPTNEILSLKAVYRPKNHVFSEKNCFLKDFHFLKCIGKGGTSLVSLVRHMKTGRLFAMKQIPKPLLKDPRRLKQIMVERDVLNKLNCPFLADLICAFESENFLNFLMEYYPGGELFFHLKKLKFTEEIARFYFVQILFSLEFLHSQKILYRDLKPENLILDLYGYIRLTDFGLCKRGLEDRELTHSFCGSPEYMAPEVINNKGHSYTVDFYTLGALLYEFTTGLPPYYSKNPLEIRENINNSVLKLPEKLSLELKELLLKLLSKDPNDRIRDFNCLKEVKWLKNVDWKGIYEKKIIAPIQLSLFQSNLHLEFSKIAISSDKMKENPGFQREYPNFEYFTLNSPVFFEPVFVFTQKRPVSVKTNSKEEKTIEKRKFSVKIPLKAKTSLTKNNLLLNNTVNGIVSPKKGALTSRIGSDLLKKQEFQRKKLFSVKNKENLTNISLLSPKKSKLRLKTTEKKSLILEKTDNVKIIPKKVNSEKKTGFMIPKVNISGKVTKFLGNKTLLMKNWGSLKENLIENGNGIESQKSFKIIAKNSKI